MAGTRNNSGAKNPNYKGGIRKHPLYDVWGNMMRRCHNKKSIQYKDYGARGITVCAEWSTAAKFIDWALPLWKEGLTLDRIDNDKGYSPENCRFSTRLVQRFNQRMRSSNTSGFTGVHFQKPTRRWQARGTINGVRQSLGAFDKLEDAVEARRQWERENIEPLLKQNGP